MKYPHLMNELYNQPWLIHQSKLQELESVLLARASGHITMTAEDVERMAAMNNPPAHVAGQDVMILPVSGTITHHASMMNMASGGTSTAQLSRVFREAVANPDIGTIIFEHRSGGGAVFGTPEFARQVFNARGQKRIISHVNAYSFSASYYIAAAGHEIVCTPSGEVGSIGTACLHRDVSKWEESMGVKTTVIAIPEKKVDGHPYAPITDTAHANILEKCAKTYDTFVSDVAEFRGVTADKVKADYGGGGTLLAADALRQGMIDSIATLDEVIEDIRQSARPNRRNANRLALAELA